MINLDALVRLHIFLWHVDLIDLPSSPGWNRFLLELEHLCKAFQVLLYFSSLSLAPNNDVSLQLDSISQLLLLFLDAFLIQLDVELMLMTIAIALIAVKQMIQLLYFIYILEAAISTSGYLVVLGEVLGY